MFSLLAAYHSSVLLSTVGTLLVLYAAWKTILPLAHFRGRRLLLSRWRRLTDWQYWPCWVVHIPTACYVFWLGIQFRCLTFFTLVNPAIPNSGLIVAPKSKILSALEAAQAPLACWTLIPYKNNLEQQWEQLEVFRQQYSLDYPLVFKPDEGQRGLGVAIIRSKEAGQAYLQQATVDTIVQEYISGREYGVFYYRYPDSETGDIFSITDKRMTSVIGDGHSSLEHLILANGPTLALAPLLLKRAGKKLRSIPAKGESVPITELGTHALGSLFLDSNALKTPELVKAIDRFSRRYSGFYMGRYDLRVPSVEDLKNGEGIKILELNGVTSEPTHIYDPRYSYAYGCRTLFQQCRIVFDIARQNGNRGCQATSLRRLLSQVWLILRRQRRIKKSADLKKHKASA